MNYQTPMDLQNSLSSLQAQLAQMQHGGGYVSYTPPIYPQPVYNQISPPAPQPVISRQVDSVHGVKGALEYQNKLAPGSNCIILDDENDIIYFVRKDANGNVPEKLTIGDFKLRKENCNENEYVTKQDFNEAIDKIMKLVGKDNA